MKKHTESVSEKSATGFVVAASAGRKRAPNVLKRVLRTVSLGCLLLAALASAVACNSPFALTVEATLTAPVPAANLGKVAYIQGGDIWVKALPDGEPRRFTDDGHNSEPRWSPSGRWLAFRKDVEVWVVDAEGNNAHVLDNRAPVNVFAWSPVEDRLAYISGSGTLRLEAINADGTAPATLVPDTAGQSGQIAWGRVAWETDGRRVTYVWERIGSSGALRDYVGIWSVETQHGSEPVELYAIPGPPQDGLILAGWAAGEPSPSLLFWRDPLFSASAAADGLPLLCLSPDGGEPVVVADFTLLHPDFWSGSPTGRQIALTAGAGRETWTNKRIVLVNLETGDREYLTDETESAFSPVFSPDGRRIAYVAAPDVGHVWGGDEAEAGMAQRRIWVMTADGSDRRRLTEDPAYRDERPLWSADGTHLLFARLDGEGGISLWLVDAAGGAPRRVVDGLTPSPQWFGYYGHIAWDDLFDWWRESTERLG